MYLACEYILSLDRNSNPSLSYLTIVKKSIREDEWNQSERVGVSTAEMEEHKANILSIAMVNFRFQAPSKLEKRAVYSMGFLRPRKGWDWMVSIA